MFTLLTPPSPDAAPGPRAGAGLPGPRVRWLGPLVAGIVLAWPLAASAEKADRSKPMTLESDQPCTVNLQKKTSACSGNVSIAQGTMLIRADRLELRETTDGHQLALAQGEAGKPATFRQKREGLDEVVEAQAARIDYDSKTGTLRFEGQAQVRRLQAGVQADEISGALIVWDSVGETFNVRGGAPSASNPGGRVRAVIAPRKGADAASADATSANGAASAPAPLRSTPALGDRR